MQYTQMYLLFQLSAEVKAELYPILLFFGMFFVVFGLGGVLIRHLPRKSGSMLDEILNDDWEQEEDWKEENHTPKENEIDKNGNPAGQIQTAAELSDSEEKNHAAEESNRK